MLDRLFHNGRITWSIGDEQTIIFLASQLREVVVPRDDLNLDTSVDQAAQLVVLQTNIDANNTHGST